MAWSGSAGSPRSGEKRLHRFGTRRRTSWRAALRLPVFWRRTEFCQLAQLFEQTVRTRRFLFIETADREPHVYDDVVADFRFRNILKARLAHDPAELHPGHLQAVGFKIFDDLTGDAETHERLLSHDAAGT